jgi:hypothetical protein
MSRAVSIDQLPMSASTRRLNAQLLGDTSCAQTPVGLGMAKAKADAAKDLPEGKRIRQSKKPLMNGLEREFYETYLLQYYTAPQIHAQRFSVRLSNGENYRPDFVCITGNETTVWECKGPFAYRGGLEKLKRCATVIPTARHVLVWKEDGEWKQQIVLPEQ